MVVTEQEPNRNSLDEVGHSASRGAVLPGSTGGGERAGFESSGSTSVREMQRAQSGAPTAAGQSLDDNGRSKQNLAQRPGLHRTSGRWWVAAAVSAVILTLLTVAGIRLVTKQSGTVDQLVILTVPSGADIKFDSTPLGHSPVKLEEVRAGLHTLEITKEGFETIIQEINIVEPQTLDYKLKPLPPGEMGLSPEEQIRQFQQRAERAFAKSDYAIPYEGSALYYADIILSLEEANQYAISLRERVQKALHQAAQNEASRGDLGQAQETYAVLVGNYPDDEAARAAAAKIDAQLATRRGEVRDLVRRAEEAMLAGNLIEPARASAYYYSKLVLAIDRQNAQARAIRSRIKENLSSASDGAAARGEIGQAVAQLEQATRLFPDDRELSSRLRELVARRAEDQERANDPFARRVQGLQKYNRDEFAEAISDLEFAAANGRATPDVLFALGRSYLKLHQLDRAAYYFRQVPQIEPDSYRSSIAALGDIAAERGEANSALERYRQARALGGSTLYSIATLDDKIERLDRKQREKETAPTPVSIQARHIHQGVFGGSCKGILSVSSTGVRFDGEHTFAANFVGVSAVLTGDYLVLKFHRNEKFKTSRADAERFQEALSRYQLHASANR